MKRKPATAECFNSEKCLLTFQSLRDDLFVEDKQFDELFPAKIRKLSGKHWTPIAVVKRAVELMRVNGQTRVLDIGSGPGKFCLVGSLLSRGTFTGLEQRAYLVKVSRSLVREGNLARVSFIEGELGLIDWSKFNAFYIYNPFYENVEKSARIDDASEMNRSRYRRHVKQVQLGLALAPRGSRVVTFHGLGGRIPQDYERVSREPMLTDFLELWVKRR